MRILITTVKPMSAIDRLTAGMVKYMDHLEIRTIPVHPKRPSSETLYQWQSLADWADVLDFQYWKNSQMLLAMFPNETKGKPKILTHHNPYDIINHDWSQFDEVVVKNQTQGVLYPRGVLIPHAIDLKFFKYNDNYTKDKTIGMVVGRIEGKKGVLEVAQACKELGYKLLLVGMVSEPDYMKNVLDTGVVDFREGVSDDELYKAYTEMSVLVVNSQDNFESGPLPILEAMACGVPVLTRDLGLVPDIYDGKNMWVRQGEKNDLEDLKTELKILIDNPDKREALRIEGWETVKNRDERRTAISYERIWAKHFYKDSLVSVIVPTKDRPEVLIENLAAIVNQDYPAKEIIVCDDGRDHRTFLVVAEMRKKTNITIKYVKTASTTYGLAKARNAGVIEAIGEILVFCDERLRMEQGALQALVSNTGNKKWLWGEKDGAKKGFVENFSSVKRRDLINGGMFNERVDKYGGMTQEIRTRFEKGQNFEFEYVPEAKCSQIIKSGARNKKREEMIDMKTLIWRLYG